MRKKLPHLNMFLQCVRDLSSEIGKTIYEFNVDHAIKYFHDRNIEIAKSTVYKYLRIMYDKMHVIDKTPRRVKIYQETHIRLLDDKGLPNFCVVSSDEKMIEPQDVDKHVFFQEIGEKTLYFYTLTDKGLNMLSEIKEND